MPESDIETIFRLWRTRRTIMQLCRDRGYNVSESETELTQEAFNSKYGTTPSDGHPQRTDLNTVVYKQDATDGLGIYFPNDIKVGISTIRVIIDDMNGNDLTKAIVIVRAAMTSSAKKFLNEMPADSVQVQAFEEAELMVNITEHELVPKHEVLNEEEKKELMKRYKLKEQQLPRIRITDPVAKYYGMKRGQVVRITRKSPTSGRYVTYRLVH